MFSNNIINEGMIDAGIITHTQAGLIKAYAEKHAAYSGNVASDFVIPAGVYKIMHRGSFYQFTLNLPVKHCGELNPQSILPSQQKALQALLAVASQTKALAPDIYCVPVQDGGKNVLHILQLKTTLSVRKKFSDIDYYDVIDKSPNLHLGDGSFGDVYVLPGTIKPRYFNKNDVFFSPGERKRVAKLQRHRHRQNSGKKPYAKLTRAKREAELLGLSSHAKVRDINLLYDEQEATSIISMMRYDGNDMKAWLEYDESLRKLGMHQKKVNEIADELSKFTGNDTSYLLEEYTKSLSAFCDEMKNWQVLRVKLNPMLRRVMTVKDRIEWSIMALREYKQKIHDKNLLHRDFKAENIFLDTKNVFGARTNIIDYGLACRQSSTKQAAKSVGTILYKAPESLAGADTPKSESYALMRVIGLIWRDTELMSQDYPGVTRRSYINLRKNQKVINFKLFEGLDIDSDLAVMIETAIRKGTEWDADMRLDINALIAAFENIRLKFYYDSVDDDYVEDITKAQDLALSLQNIKSAAEISRKIKDFAGNISAHPQVLDIFVKTLGVHAFYGCLSFNEVIQTADLILSTYLSSCDSFYSRVFQLSSVAASSGIEAYKQYIEHCKELARIWTASTMSLGVVAMQEETMHITEKLLKLNEAAVYYQKMMDENTAMNRKGFAP